MIAEVIAIGDEMTGGARLDTNSQWLAQQLVALGVDVRFHTTVGDSFADNLDVFRRAVDRADIVIASGGLGPTQDDLTRDVIAALVAEPLELRDDVLAIIQAMFTSRGRTMAQRNQVQAMYPRSARVIPNPHGTAPGIAIEVKRTGNLASGQSALVYALPGVPAEMYEMFRDTVAMSIREHQPEQTFIHNEVLKFFGAGESEMEQRLGNMISREHVPRVGITVSAATISLRITAIAPSELECRSQILATRAEIMKCVGDLYFGDGEGYEQQHAVGELLARKKHSLLVLELGSAAPLADQFASLEDNSLIRGTIAFPSRQSLLEFADKPDIESAIQWFQSRSQADWVLAIDAYPSLKTFVQQNQPHEFALHVLDPSSQHDCRTQRISGHPDILHQRIAKTALAWMRSKCQPSSNPR